MEFTFKNNDVVVMKLLFKIIDVAYNIIKYTLSKTGICVTFFNNNNC